MDICADPVNLVRNRDQPRIYIYVAVNFLFPLFWGMVMYANEFATMEKYKLTEIKN